VEPIDFACTINPAGLKQRVNQLDSLVPQVLGLRRDGLTLALVFRPRPRRTSRHSSSRSRSAVPSSPSRSTRSTMGCALESEPRPAVKRCWRFCRPRSPATPPSFAPSSRRSPRRGGPAPAGRLDHRSSASPPGHRLAIRAASAGSGRRLRAGLGRWGAGLMVMTRSAAASSSVVIGLGEMLVRLR
jgi:hypothetical protein